MTMKFKRKLSFDLPRTHRMVRGAKPAKDPKPGRKPKISRMVALGIKFDEMLRRGEVDNATELARLNHVSQPRMTQILSMSLLAPDIQETLLCLPRTERGRAKLHEKLMRPIAAEIDWDRQRELWRALIATLKIELPALVDTDDSAGDETGLAGE